MNHYCLFPTKANVHTVTHITPHLDPAQWSLLDILHYALRHGYKTLQNIALHSG